MNYFNKMFSSVLLNQSKNFLFRSCFCDKVQSVKKVKIINCYQLSRKFTTVGCQISLKSRSLVFAGIFLPHSSKGLNQNVASFTNCVRSLHSKNLNSVNYTSLQSLKKRVPRKKKLELESDKKPGVHNVFSFATAEEYDLASLREGLIKADLYNPSDIDDFGREDVLFVEARYNVTSEPRQIYFFREGAVVFWNMSVDECMSVLDFLKQFEHNSYEENLVQNEQEVMAYMYAATGKRSGLEDGHICLASDQKPVQIALDKYTFSNSIAMSVKLGVWEGLLESYIASIENVTEDLKLGNKIRISREDALKKTGELFALRHNINLSSDILDVPDFYWDREELERLYLKMSNYFAISRRTKVVNEKISHCLELVDLISSHLNDNHHVRLEWMIIILIMVEVGIEVLHYASSSGGNVHTLLPV